MQKKMCRIVRRVTDHSVRLWAGGMDGPVNVARAGYRAQEWILQWK